MKTNVIGYIQLIGYMIKRSIAQVIQPFIARI